MYQLSILMTMHTAAASSAISPLKYLICWKFHPALLNDVKGWKFLTQLQQHFKLLPRLNNIHCQWHCSTAQASLIVWVTYSVTHSAFCTGKVSLIKKPLKHHWNWIYKTLTFWSCFTIFLLFLKSQNHRMFWVEGTLKISWLHPPCHKQGYLPLGFVQIIIHQTKSDELNRSRCSSTEAK